MQAKLLRALLPVALPPLRERLADIMALAEHFNAMKRASTLVRRPVIAADLAFLPATRHPRRRRIRQPRQAKQAIETIARKPGARSSTRPFALWRRAMPDDDDVLSWLHIGDLDITTDTEQNYRERRDGGTRRGRLHAHYPADLRQGAEHLGALLGRPHVTCVDMGHTHYNELADDGGTIFMAARSTGQIEEGPPGFAIAAVDGRGVSWRFKALDDGWPFVLITRPTDRRLATDASRHADGTALVRAKVLGDAPIQAVEVQADGGAWCPMQPVAGHRFLWAATGPADARRIVVRGRDSRGRSDADQIEPAADGWTPPKRHADGSDADRRETWPERGIVGGQLGPNRNGRQW